MKIFNRFIRPWRGRTAILCYHRVLPDEIVNVDKSPLKDMVVSVSNFEEQMKFIHNNYTVVSMDQLIDHLNSKSKEFVVAVTFDDGYIDNYTHALPILDSYNIPATIYITTRFPEKDCEMFWYELWELINSKNKIIFRNRGKLYKFKLTNNKSRIIVFNKLKNIINQEDPLSQKKIMSRIRGNVEKINYFNICLNWEEIKNISQYPNISIGSHSHSHYSFGILNDNEKNTELYHSKKLIEKNLGMKINHFAYPFGQMKDCNLKDSKILHDLGYKSASVAFPFKLHCNSFNQYYLPRIVINDSPISTFKSKLNGCINLFSYLRNKTPNDILD